MTLNDTYQTGEQFLAALNEARRGRNGQWILFSGTVAGRSVQLKSYGASYLQIYRVDGANQRLPPMDCKVSQWKEAVLAPFTGGQ